MTIKLIVGIGNIGVAYNHTRHNLGHKYVQLLAAQYKVNLIKNSMLFGYLGLLKIHNIIIRLLIPNTYMNNSGVSVSKCIDYYGLSCQEILVAHDELDLSPGIIRIRLGRNLNASHQGIKDIIKKLNNNFDFYRLRIGIGRPLNKTEIINFVLSQPSEDEKQIIYFTLKKAIQYTEDIILKNFMKVDL